MPFDNTKTLSFNQYQKFDKGPFICCLRRS